MEISFNKVQALADAMGEGAEVVVGENGSVVIRTNRIFTNGDVDAPMPVATVYNKLCVNYEEAEQLVNELKPFTLYGGMMKGEWAEGLYVISSCKSRENERIYQVIATFDPNYAYWDITSEEEFKAIKGNSTNMRHYNWVCRMVRPEPEPEPKPEYTVEDFSL